jgi:hypothetical protein
LNLSSLCSKLIQDYATKLSRIHLTLSEYTTDVRLLLFQLKTARNLVSCANKLTSKNLISMQIRFIMTSHLREKPGFHHLIKNYYTE